MQVKDLVVENPHGLHLRVAGEVVNIARRHGGCNIQLSCEGCRFADGCSVLQMLLLEASPGKQVRLTVDGPDEEQVVKEVTELFVEGAGI